MQGTFHTTADGGPSEQIRWYKNFQYLLWWWKRQWVLCWWLTSILAIKHGKGKVDIIHCAWKKEEGSEQDEYDSRSRVVQCHSKEARRQCLVTACAGGGYSNHQKRLSVLSGWLASYCVGGILAIMLRGWGSLWFWRGWTWGYTYYVPIPMWR